MYFRNANQVCAKRVESEIFFRGHEAPRNNGVTAVYARVHDHGPKVGVSLDDGQALCRYLHGAALRVGRCIKVASRYPTPIHTSGAPTVWRKDGAAITADSGMVGVAMGFLLYFRAK
jgi:hypothetical protein